RTGRAAVAAARVDPARDRVPVHRPVVGRRVFEGVSRLRLAGGARIGDARGRAHAGAGFVMDYERFLSHTGRELHESAIRRMGTVVARAGDLVSFAPGYPDASLFPWQELQDIAGQLLTGRDGSALQYGPTRGYQPLIEAIVGVL